MAEPARQVIAEQRTIDGQGVWGRDTRLFLELMLSRAINQFNVKISNSEKCPGVIYYDRAIPDCLAYAASAGMVLPHFERAALEFRYEQDIWLLSPWQDIYMQDSERHISFAETCEFHWALVGWYTRVGYRVREVGPSSVEQRVELVLGGSPSGRR